MSAENRARELVAAALRRDAAAQEAGDTLAIGASLDDVLVQVRAQQADAPELGAAFTFWDWWTDASNHEWRYYEGIARDDWPRLARHVADALEAGAPPSDPVLVRHFELAARPGPLTRLARWLGLARAAKDASGSER